MRLVLRLDPPRGGVFEHEFDERGGVIGRSRECDLVLDCPNKLISRRHAVISFSQNRFWLYDASANGVFHNDSPEPVGIGGSTPIEDGDSFRMGDYLLRAIVVDTPGSAAAPPAQNGAAPAAEPQPEPQATAEQGSQATVPADPVSAIPARVPEAVAGAGFEAPKPLKLDEAVEAAFTPPSVVIPEDWDLELDLEPERPSVAPTAQVSRQLSGVETAASQALWKALIPELEDDVPPELTPEMAEAIGRCLRICIRGLLELQVEHDMVEQQLTGRRRQLPEWARGMPERDTLEFCRNLAYDVDGRESVEFLQRSFAELDGKHADVVAAFRQSLDTVIGQFSPQKFEERWEQQQAAEEGKGAVGLVKTKLGLKSGIWDFVKAWHEEQRRNGYKSVYQLFDKLFLSVYARRQKDRMGSGGRRSRDDTY